MIRAATRLQAWPRLQAVRFGTRLGSLAYRVAGRQRRRALANLHLAYGEALSPAERDALTRQVFQHFGRAVVDFLRAPALRLTDLRAFISYEGWDAVETARNRGKGIIFVTGHLGNWELLGRWLATIQKVPLTVVAREPENPALAQYMRTMRENAGFTVLSKGDSARGLLRALKRGEAILILNDQNSADAFAPFFGIPTGTAVGPASLALHSGAALIPLYCVEKPDHSFHMICLPPLDVANTTTGAEEDTDAPRGKQAEVLRITKRLNQILEGIVRQYPEQWLWLHNRWKSAFEEKRRNVIWTCDAAFENARERWKT